MNGGSQPKILAPGASPEEAAAITAALAQFARDTAPAAQRRTQPTLSAWKRAALVEGVSRQPDLRPEH